MQNLTIKNVLPNEEEPIIVNELYEQEPLKKSTISKNIGRNKDLTVALLITLYVFGLGMAMVFYHNCAETVKIFIDTTCSDYITLRQNNNFYQNILLSITSEMGVLILLFVFGFSMVGEVFSYLVCSAKAVGVGILLSFCYNEMGLVFNLYNIIPKTVLYFAIFVFACKKSVITSKKLWYVYSGYEEIPEKKRYFVKRYCLFFLFLTLATCLIGVVDSAFGYLFDIMN